MGNYILCQVKRARHPFYVESVGLNLYSIEELCYFICNNYILVDEEMFGESLTGWFRTELQLRTLAQKLDNIRSEEHRLADLVLPVLREVHYLASNGMREMEGKLILLEELKPEVRAKRRGDALIGYKKYRKAIETYLDILNSLPSEEKGLAGSISHNMGCAYARLFQMTEACECFRNAYEILHSSKTLESYLYAVYMKDGEEAYERLSEKLGVDEITKDLCDSSIEKIRKRETPEDLDGALSQWTDQYHKSVNM